MDIYGFYTGKIFNAYEYMGAHVQSKGTLFLHLCSQRFGSFSNRRFQRGGLIFL